MTSPKAHPAPLGIFSRMRRGVVDVFRRYQRLHWFGKLFIWFLIFFHVGLIALFVTIHPDVIFQFLYNLAKELRESRFGWLIIAGVLILTSIPPVFGFSTTLTVVGFAYGVPGWLLAAPCAVIGAAISFLLLRFIFRHNIKRWTGNNDKWQAMEAVIRHHGLPLIILVRICPLPWVYSNAFFASIESVSFWQFVFATLFMAPRFFLNVFIGSRIALFSDGEHRGRMDTMSTVLNIVSIAVGVGVGIGTGVLIYRLTMRKIKELEGLPPDVEDLAADALEDAERSALLGNYSSEDMDGPTEHDTVRRASSRSPTMKD